MNKLHALCLGSLLVLAVGGTPASLAADRPNILFAIADDWSYGHASAYGCNWVKTPAFDRVAREGLLFLRTYTPNAKCAPSRACVLTGRNSWQLKEAANHVPFFPVEFKTYAEALAEQGYFVGMTAKGWAPGTAKNAEGKNRNLAGTPFNKRTTRPPARGMNNNDYAGNFEEFLDASSGQPWCFWYGGTEPHRNYEYGAGVAKGGKKISDIAEVPRFWPDNEVVRNDLLDYAFEVEYFDRHLGLMLEALQKRGQLDNTLVLVTSDNGMPFPRAKGNEYEYSNHMPLAAMWKNGIKNPGRKITDYVSFVDFAPTFIEVAGLKWEQTGMQPSAGASLFDIFLGGAVKPARKFILLGQERHDVGRPDDVGYPIRSIIENDVLYLHNFEPSRWPACNPETGYLNCDGGPTKTEVLKTRTNSLQKSFWELSFGKRPQEELYDLKKDPECLNNLAGHTDYRELQAKLKAKLFDELKRQQDPRMFGQGHVFDAYPYSEDKMRNFYNRYMKGEKFTPGWVEASDFEKDKLD